ADLPASRARCFDGNACVATGLKSIGRRSPFTHDLSQDVQFEHRSTKVKAKLGFPDRRRQRGQTVLWFLATIAACCCVFALVYNVGQVTNHKEATVNAGDAA